VRIRATETSRLSSGETGNLCAQQHQVGPSGAARRPPVVPRAEWAGRWHRAGWATPGPDQWRSRFGQPKCTESGVSADFTLFISPLSCSKHFDRSVLLRGATIDWVVHQCACLDAPVRRLVMPQTPTIVVHMRLDFQSGGIDVASCKILK